MKRFEELEWLEIGVSTSPLGSGGMRSKVVAAEMATAAGIPALILNGTRPETIAAALEDGGEGTRFHPQEGRVSSFKLWLKYAKPTRGRLEVDAGAEQALRERGTSLLPVGVVERARGLRGGRRRGGLPAPKTAARSGRGSSTTPPPSCAGSRD